MVVGSEEQETDGAADLVERASRLFDFLIRVQQLTSRPVRHVDSYKRDDGAVLWLHEIPRHEAFEIALSVSEPSPDSPTLVLNRVPRLDPPELPDELRPWVAGRIHDPEVEPELKDSAVLLTEEDDPSSELTQPSTDVYLDDRPEIGDLFLEWFDEWSAWSDREKEDRPARDLYNELFRTYILQRNAPEDWELVVGVGALAWAPDDHDAVLRHCFTHELDLGFDDDTGRITVQQDPDASLTLELDMLDVGLWPDHARVQDIKEATNAFVHHVLDRDRSGEMARRLVHNISADATYADEDMPPVAGPSAACSFAPALIFRKRSHRGLIEIFKTIKSQIQERGEVPAGLRVLLDPQDTAAEIEVFDEHQGAWIEDDGEVFLPLPINDRQLEVIRRVDRRALTLVQGPPGTGKTHTAAALISHLLAQGKRVLVTAQTDRALKELRSQLPPDIRDLSVSIVGTGRDELAELRVAVKRLSEKATEYTGSSVEAELTEIREGIEDLKGQKAGVICGDLCECAAIAGVLLNKGLLFPGLQQPAGKAADASPG